MNDRSDSSVRAQAVQARVAWPSLARSEGRLRRDLLLDLADRIEASAESILAANARDLATARSEGLAGALMDRLRLDATRLHGVTEDLRRVALLDDPLAHRFDPRTLESGLRICRQRVPLGVLGIIYEARPNVTIDIAGLALKSGNAVVLRGGRESRHGNRRLVDCVHEALAFCGLDPALVQFIDRDDRESVRELLDCTGLIDLVIPRGGQALQDLCLTHGRIPVVSGGIGICHLYVDRAADLDRALPVIENAKVQRPTVCNALDTLLVHRAVASAFLPRVVQQLAAHGVRFRAEGGALEHVAGMPGVEAAGTDDFSTEWLSLVLGLKVVDGIADAMHHIAAYGTGHSDGILSDDARAQAEFLAQVDSAAVYVNASTRFTDGGQFGLGAEVAVSTQRVQARGPMGLEALTSYKWLVQGDYQPRP